MSGQPVKQWEKASTGSGVVYYVNHIDKKNQWDHPNYQVMLEMLDDCNSIKYAAYRTAAKLCVLQRFFSMNQVPLKIISGVFDKHQMRTTENNLELSSSELEDIVYDILFATHTSTAQCLINVDLNTELILNFLLSVFDCARRKSVKVLSAKVVLTILCASSMESKIHYLFQQLSDHNQCVSKRKMECFLLSCTSLMHYLAESIAFSPNLIKPTLKSCFQENDKFVGLTEDSFVRWFLSEPRVILWFPIFYRLKTAENELHQVACSTCRVQPIRGLRYKCLRCMSYDQCQNCFFTRRVSRRHKLRHPMQEYCWQGGSRRSTLEYLKSLIKRICGYESRLQYLPVEPTDFAAGRDADCTTETIDTQASNHVTLTSLKPDSELSSIIGLLESENKRLEKEMKHIDSEYLREHKDQIRAQIQRLKKVKTHINLLCSQPKNKLGAGMQSTPMLRGPGPAPSFNNLLSPIAASDTSTSGISMSPRGSFSPGNSLSPRSSGIYSGNSHSPGNTDTGTSTFSLGTTLDSRVTTGDISTWIGARHLSQPSLHQFDFSALLCPKPVSASYRVLSDETDKENQRGMENQDKENPKTGAKKKRNKKESFYKSESFQILDEECESRAANSSFSLDEVLAKYECDSRFSTNTTKSQSFLKKTRSLFDISGRKNKVERSALSTLNLEDNHIPCDALRNGSRATTDGSRDNASRLSYVSCVSRDSAISTHTLLSSANSCDNLREKSMGSEDYLESIRRTCTDMYSLQDTSKLSKVNQSTRGNFSTSLEQRAASRLNACPDRIRRRQSSMTPSGARQGDVSSQTLPRMFRTPGQNTSAYRHSGNFLNFEQNSQSTCVSQLCDERSLVNGTGACRTNAHNGEPNRSEQSIGNYSHVPNQNTKRAIAQGISKSSESLSMPRLSLPKTSPSNKSTSHKDFTSHQDLRRRKGDWLCDSLNSLLSQEGGIESSLLDLRGDVIVQDEQLFLLQDEIDNILVKLRTILATV